MKHIIFMLHKSFSDSSESKFTESSVYKYKVDPDIFDITKTEDGCINIYKNDLKHRKSNGINIDKVIGYNGVDMDTPTYRFSECINENKGQMLDLCDLDLSSLPNINNFVNLKMLFVSDNKLTGRLDLRHLYNLTVIDCSMNQLTKIPLLPPNIEEFNCKNNQITSIDELKNYKIQRIDVSNNKIKNIPIIESVKILFCENNHITTVHILPNIVSFDCRNNNISQLPTMPLLSRLECDNNILIAIPVMPCLKHLYCTNNKLVDLGIFNELEHINFIDNHIKELPYLPKLKECICSYDKIERISSEYKVRHTLVINNILSMEFDN